MYNAIEGQVKDGVIIPVEPCKIPQQGRALIILLTDTEKKAEWKVQRKETGWLKIEEDPIEWQQRVRSEWNHRP